MYFGASFQSWIFFRVYVIKILRNSTSTTEKDKKQRIKFPATEFISYDKSTFLLHKSFLSHYAYFTVSAYFFPLRPVILTISININNIIIIIISVSVTTGCQRSPHRIYKKTTSGRFFLSNGNPGKFLLLERHRNTTERFPNTAAKRAAHRTQTHKCHL
jgi:hypothetical protein